MTHHEKQHLLLLRNLLAILHLALAAILLTKGLLLNVHPIPLYIDTAFCLAAGTGLLIANQKPKNHFKTNP